MFSNHFSSSCISIHAPREGCDIIFITISFIRFYFNPRTPRGVRRLAKILAFKTSLFQSTHPARGATLIIMIYFPFRIFQSTHPARGATSGSGSVGFHRDFNPRTPRGVRRCLQGIYMGAGNISIHAPREGCDFFFHIVFPSPLISIHAPREGCDRRQGIPYRHHRISIHAPREGCDISTNTTVRALTDFNPRTPRGVRQQTLPKSREFAWLNLLICTRGRRLSIRKQTRLCSMKLSFMLFGCEPAGEGVSSWTSHATKSKVRLEGRSAYSQSVRSSAHSDFPGNKSGGCPVRDP